MAASAEEELEQLQHLNLGGLDNRDGVLDEVRVQAAIYTAGAWFMPLATNSCAQQLTRPL